MIVSIDNKEYYLRYSLRSLFKYEQLTGHPYAGQTLEDALMACNPEYSLTFEQLIDQCDIDPTIFDEFMSIVQAEADRLAQLKKKVKPAKVNKKKD